MHHLASAHCMPRASILLVEDDESVRMAFEVRLRAHGYRVVTANDGESAIAQALATPPDAILLDLGLPDRPGTDVLAALRRNPACAAIPIVVISGRDMNYEEAALLATGASACLQKPSRPGQLIDTLDRLLTASDHDTKPPDVDR